MQPATVHHHPLLHAVALADRPPTGVQSLEASMVNICMGTSISQSVFRHPTQETLHQQMEGMDPEFLSPGNSGISFLHGDTFTIFTPDNHKSPIQTKSDRRFPMNCAPVCLGIREVLEKATFDQALEERRKGAMRVTEGRAFQAGGLASTKALR